MAWGALIPLIASMLGGAADGYMKNATAKDGQQGYDMPYMTPSQNDAQNQQLTSQMGQQMAIRAMAGRLGVGEELLLERIKAEQLRQERESMYGRLGQRGGSTMDNTINMASKGGVGPKAMMAQGSRAMQDHVGRNSQIMNYIDSLKVAGLQKQRKDSAGIMQSAARSNQIPYTGQVVPMNTPAQPGFDAGLSNIDYRQFSQDAGWIPKDPPPQYNIYTAQTANTGGKTV